MLDELPRFEVSMSGLPLLRCAVNVVRRLPLMHCLLLLLLQRTLSRQQLRSPVAAIPWRWATPRKLPAACPLLPP